MGKSKGVPKSNIKNVKGKDKLTVEAIIHDDIKFIEVVRSAFNIITKKNLQCDNHTIIRLQIIMEYNISKLFQYYKLSSANVSKIASSIIEDKNFDNEVNEFIDGIVTSKNILVTENIKSEFDHVKKTNTFVNEVKQ